MLKLEELRKRIEGKIIKHVSLEETQKNHNYLTGVCFSDESSLEFERNNSVSEIYDYTVDFKLENPSTFRLTNGGIKIEFKDKKTTNPTFETKGDFIFLKSVHFSDGSILVFKDYANNNFLVPFVFNDAHDRKKYSTSGNFDSEKIQT